VARRAQCSRDRSAVVLIGPAIVKGLFSLLHRWSPAIFWCAASAIAILLLQGRTEAYALSAVALPAFVGLVRVRREKFRALGIGPLSLYGLATDVSTSGGAGFAPVGSGTFGAIAALPLGDLLAPLDPVVRWGILVAGTGVSVFATHHYLIVKRKMLGLPPGAKDTETHSKDLDPSEVVIDESIGVLLALAFVPWDLGWATAAFVLFRAFDIAKPGPVGWAERRLPGAWAVVFDDVIAGLMAGALLALARYLPTLL
jgi:phosphatidylglycerophosphatase A